MWGRANFFDNMVKYISVPNHLFLKKIGMMYTYAYTHTNIYAWF